MYKIEKLLTWILIPQQSTELKVSLSQHINLNFWPYCTHIGLCHYQIDACSQLISFYLIKSKEPKLII